MSSFRRAFHWNSAQAALSYNSEGTFRFQNCASLVCADIFRRLGCRQHLGPNRKPARHQTRCLPDRAVLARSERSLPRGRRPGNSAGRACRSRGLSGCGGTGYGGRREMQRPWRRVDQPPTPWARQPGVVPPSVRHARCSIRGRCGRGCGGKILDEISGLISSMRATVRPRSALRQPRPVFCLKQQVTDL